MKAMYPKRTASRSGLWFGGLAAGALGLALAAAGASSAAQNPDDEMGMSQPGSMADTAMQSQTQGTSSLPPNVSPGWKLRICSENTKADQIRFTVIPAPGSKNYGSMGGTGSQGQSGMGGTGESSDSAASQAAAPQSTTWNRGESTEITLPPELHAVEKIRIEATPSQDDQKASVCVLYNDHVAKKLNFDNREVSTVQSSDNGQCGC